MTRSERILALGDLGERTVLRWFNYHGIQGERTDDWFDAEKDMTVEGKTVEVKTLLPIYMYNAFCLPFKQGPKCDEVDRLIFLQIPKNGGEALELYESEKDEDGKRDYFKEYFNNEFCRFYRLTSLTKLGTIWDYDVSNELWKLSPSTYKGYA